MRKSQKKFFILCSVWLVFICFLPLSAPGKTAVRRPLLINGAGASFPYILYSKWFLEYRKSAPDIMINYRSIGSGGGIRQFLTGALDFGATDVPMLKEQVQKAKKEILHLPTALGAVIISYNLPSLKNTTLRLTAEILVDIYMKKITKWNHEDIRKVNPGVLLPDKNIVPIYRADGSGTTAVFTEYLSQFSKKWLERVGKGKAVNWITGIGGKGNEGVMGLVQKIPGAIGYVAMSYAIDRNLQMAEVQNMSGHFVKADTQTVRASAKQMLEKTNDLFQPLVVARGENVYPMSSYTYLLVYKEMFSEKGKALVRFLNWYLTVGQSFCEKLHYIPLPKPVIQEVKNRIQMIQVDDKKDDDKKT